MTQIMRLGAVFGRHKVSEILDEGKGVLGGDEDPVKLPLIVVLSPRFLNGRSSIKCCAMGRLVSTFVGKTRVSL